jgi:general secretion pathway protein J
LPQRRKGRKEKHEFLSSNPLRSLRLCGENVIFTFSSLDDPMQPSSRARASGFTLLEVLVAVGIFALFSAMAYGSLLRILDTRDRLETERDYWRTLSLSLMQIEDDLAQARKRTVRGRDGLERRAFLGQPVDSRALGEPSLEFTRGGQIVLGDGTRSDMQRVGYQLREGTLSRLVWPALDQPPVSEPRELPLLEHVEEMRVRFYTHPGGWANSWPATTQTGAPMAHDVLPAAVELTLKIEGRGEIVRVFQVNG